MWHFVIGRVKTAIFTIDRLLTRNVLPDIFVNFLLFRCYFRLFSFNLFYYLFWLFHDPGSNNACTLKVWEILVYLFIFCLKPRRICYRPNRISFKTVNMLARLLRKTAHTLRWTISYDIYFRCNWILLPSLRFKPQPIVQISIHTEYQ